MIKQYQHEFPHYDNGPAFEQMLDWLAPLGFKDNSWHNDTCPCIALSRPDGERIIELYIEYGNREIRDDPKDLSTYFVLLYDDEGQYTDQSKSFVQAEEALAFIKQMYLRDESL